MADRIEHPEYRPDPSLGREEMEQLQRDLAKEAVFEDDFAFDPSLEDVVVAGVDQAFLDDKAVSGIVLYKNGKVIERAHAVVDLDIPYIPGLLAFREGEAILSAYEELETEPDLMVVDGSGRIHFREAGIATHMGVMLDVPTVGVAKNLLCGRLQEPLDRELARGERIAVESDDSVTAPDGTIIGYAFQSKQYSGARTVNPLYVSPGHRVSAETAVDLVEKLHNGYKLPEPTRLADSYVAEVKEVVLDGQNSLDTF